MVKLNLAALRVEFERQVFNTRQFAGLAKGIAQRRANIAQGQMENVFEEHGVTQELEAGNTGKSAYITYFKPDRGNANLFSFIGFPEGTNPVAVLRELLAEPIEVKLQTRARNAYYFRIMYPTADDIERATPMPSEYFSGNFSWARGLEDGDLPGIGQFLAIRAEASRSGGGIQVEIKDTGSSIARVPYITEILEAFRKKIQALSQ
jgi:hypothetical protein